MGLASLVTSRPPGTGAENGSSRAGLSSSPASGDCGTRCIDHGPVHTAHRATSRPRLLLLDLVVQEHLEDVEAREDLPEDLHLEGVAVRPLHGRDPRVQPLRERDVGLSRRIVRPELLVHHLPAPFLDELPRRDHLPAGALRPVRLVQSDRLRRTSSVFAFSDWSIRAKEISTTAAEIFSRLASSARSCRRSSRSTAFVSLDSFMCCLLHRKTSSPSPRIGE